MKRLLRPRILGLLLIVFVVLSAYLVYQKTSIGTALSPGDTVQVEFARDYRLSEDNSKVKMAGVEVGTVTGVQEGKDGHAIVSMKLDPGTTDKLGSTPSAKVRPTTLLGGNYYVELEPGGAKERYRGGTIPVNRTAIPVELDDVLAAVPATARQGIQDATRQVDGSLAAGAGAAIGNLLKDAPGTLHPEAQVLSALEGTRPDQDLSTLVTAADTMAATLTRTDGQLGDIVDSARGASGALATARRPLADTLDTLPATLQSTKDGLQAAQSSLRLLTDTAANARPAARELGPLLNKADPVLARAVPVVTDLKPLLEDARPLVQQLVPTATQATATLNNVAGPMLSQINGPIAHTVLSPWSGSGYYAGDGGNGHLFYQELAYMAAHAANLSSYGDKNGQMLGLGLGAGISSAGGTTLTLQNLLQSTGVIPQGTTPLGGLLGQIPVSPR